MGTTQTRYLYYFTLKEDDFDLEKTNYKATFYTKEKYK